MEEDHQLAPAATLITSGLDGPLFASPHDELTDHIVHWEPDRVLNEASPKRAVVELHRAVESGQACGSCVRLTYTDGQIELGLQPSRARRSGPWCSRMPSTQASAKSGVSDGALVGVACLARGADQIFADVILSHGGALEVISPAADFRSGA